MCQYGKERGHADIENGIDSSIRRLYRKNKESLIIATRNNTKAQYTMGKNAISWIFHATKNKTSHEKTRSWLRKRILKRETESLLITAQNNAISKENLIKPNNITNVGYVVIEIKRSTI